MPTERTTHAKRIASTMVMAILFLSALAPAQAQVQDVNAPAGRPATIRRAIDAAQFESSKKRTQRGPVPHAVQGQLRPATRAMLVALGATAGAVALGSALAAAEEGDNALRGVAIGLPVGAVLGGLVTWRLTR